jgi:LPXTG-motif cell wall-anchored protein
MGVANMKILKLNLLVTGFFCLLAAFATAQVQTESSTEKGQPTVQTTVERGEVLYVSGNDLVVKMEDGQVRNFPHIPDSAKISVDGKDLTVHDLKPGMKLERTITTTSTPQTVTTVHAVTGRVWAVSPPNSVTLRLEDGTTEQFKIPPGQRFTVEGKDTDAFGLRKGMQVTATKVVTEPKNVTSAQSKVTGSMPPPPEVPAEAMTGPVLIVVAKAPAPAKAPEVAEAKPPENPPAEAQPEAKKLPQTATDLPLFALMGTLVLLSGIVLLAKWSRAS